MAASNLLKVISTPLPDEIVLSFPDSETLLPVFRHGCHRDGLTFLRRGGDLDLGGQHGNRPIRVGTFITTAGGKITIGAAGTILTLGNFSSINDSGSLLFTSTSLINLNYSGTEVLGFLVDSTNGFSMAAGTSYSASALNSFFGTNGTINGFTGSGLITVTAVPEPATWAFLGMSLGVLAIMARFRGKRA